MDWRELQEQSLAFLQQEKQTLEHKISRRQNGFQASNRNGSTARCAAEWDLEILETIIAAQQSPYALSLESMIICKAGVLQRQIEEIRWKHGQPSPPKYWRLECQRAYLGALLRHYHAFRRNGKHE